MLYIRTFIFVTIFFLTNDSFAKKDKKTIYKYKKNESFDFESMDIGGGPNSPGDTSIDQRYKTKFNNKLPYKKNFNNELKQAIQTIF